MPNGIAVLQAALDGKKVRHHEHGRAYCGEWIDWDRFRKFGFSSLDWEWDLDEPTLTFTFTEAVAAMDAGQTVTKGDGATKYRWEDTDYWYRTDGDHEWFPDAVFGWEEVHAIDWRIVREEAKDERPTAKEAVDHLTDGIEADRLGRVTAAHAIYKLKVWKPAMFREDAP